MRRLNHPRRFYRHKRRLEIATGIWGAWLLIGIIVDAFVIKLPWFIKWWMATALIVIGLFDIFSEAHWSAIRYAILPRGTREKKTAKILGFLEIIGGIFIIFKF